MQLPPVNFARSQYAKVRPVAMNHIALNNGFIAGRKKAIVENGLLHGYNMLLGSGSIDAFSLTEEEPRGYVFRDSDVYKWLEASAYVLTEQPDHPIRGFVFDIIKKISASQDASGYINSSFPPRKLNERLTNLKDAHEIYCFGHLIQAGVALKRAGISELFETTIKAAEHVEKSGQACGHPVCEMAMVELFRETNDNKWLKCAKAMFDFRGQKPGNFENSEYYQDHLPVYQQKSAVGHAVRALYLYCGMTDYVLETGDMKLNESLLQLWQDVYLAKKYITGGIGARHTGESFGEPFELPNATAYCESCAAIASIMWNWRLIALRDESKYWDEIERVIYNGFLSSFCNDGKKYFYVNPLEADETVERKEWFSCACCPPNIMRMIASMQSTFIHLIDDGVSLNLYEPMTYDNGIDRIQIKSNYPWESKVTVITWNFEQRKIRLRIPKWCKNASVQINDLENRKVESGWHTIDRIWKPGDIIHLNLSMETCLVDDNPMVESNRGLHALLRGPIVYCKEEFTEKPQIDLQELFDPIVTIEEFVPYFAWRNRGPSRMKVWH